MPRQQHRAKVRATKKAAKPTASTKPARNVLPSGTPLDEIKTLDFAKLSERQGKGYAMWARSQARNGFCQLIDAETTVWASATDPDEEYQVTRSEENHRGKMRTFYGCTCPDYEKMGGKIDCKHTVAEKLRRGELVVAGAIKTPRNPKPDDKKQNKRNPPRKRICTSGPHEGKTVKTAQRHARIAMPKQVPELILSLKRTLDATVAPIVKAPPSRHRGGRTGTAYSTRLAALVAKVANGLSCNAMMCEFERMIEDGTLIMKKPPSDNRMSEWLNDPTVTPLLEKALALSARPFIEREVGAIIDSSKMSQLMTATAQGVDYLGDYRPLADWMKAHMLVGVETMVIMAVEFSGIRGSGTHDIKFLEPLIKKATKMFALEYLMGDKAYLSEPILKFLWGLGIKAVIPVKKKWFEDEKKAYHVSVEHLVEWFDRNNNRDFHDFYRFRPKVEALFSLMKRMVTGYCWGRGRPRKPNSDVPCTAWINEVLCKCICMNLRATVHLMAETGTKIDYLVPERRFDPPSVPLLHRSVPFKPPAYASV